MWGSASESDARIGLGDTFCSNAVNRLIFIGRKPSVVTTGQSFKQPFQIQSNLVRKRSVNPSDCLDVCRLPIVIHLNIKFGVCVVEHVFKREAFTCRLDTLLPSGFKRRRFIRHFSGLWDKAGEHQCGQEDGQNVALGRTSHMGWAWLALE